MKKAVITGATGIIGIALIQQCILNEVEVYAVCRKGSKRRKRIPNHSLVHIVENDLSEMKDLFEGKLPDCDIFYHLGWTTDADRNDMKQQIKNIGYTIDAVELADKLGCKIFVGAGSQAEYGRFEGKLNGKIPAFPENGYGMAKLCAGQMSRNECNKRGIKHIWPRILSVYGPCDSDATMISITVKKLLLNEKPLLTGGDQVWDFLYSKDAGEALFLLGEKGKNNKIYCVGSGESRPLLYYITALRDAIDPGAELGIGEIPYSDKQVMYLCADISDLTEDTGFYSRYSFEKGIAETIDWMKEELCKNNF